MNKKTIDPRVRKTRKGLHKAFFALLKRQGYDSITIQDIATEADIARITFYRHYKDKEELMTDCLNTLFDEIVESIEKEYRIHNLPQNIPTKIVFEHFEEHEEIYQILFSSRSGSGVISRIKDYMASKVLESISNFPRNQEVNIPPEIIVNHLVNAQIGIAVWWLENGKPYSIDYITQTANFLSMEGVRQAFAFPDQS